MIPARINRPAVFPFLLRFAATGIPTPDGKSEDVV
jgi:hypothetical protein